MQTVIVSGKSYRVFDNNYLVAEDGDILKNFSPCKLRLKNKYLMAGKHRAHRMVAICWLYDMQPDKHIHHINGITTDNRACNLRVTTNEDHIRDYHNSTILAMKTKNTGRKRPLEEILKLKENCGKYVRTNEVREKLRQFHLGTTLAEETKFKIKNSVRNYFQDPNNLAKYREALKTRKNGNISPCEINGTRYESLSEAARQLNMLRGAVRVRLFSKNFPAWKRLTL